mmetsp:Transcript_58636/g.93227  ORF Transcript_58636/g.93227 Transcript_58636/m.93227 type:complete len:221 (+) Transcript_58636:28-690(+)
MANLEKVKSIEQQSKDLVFGFVRSEESLVSHCVIPTLVIHFCLLYWYEAERFDEEHRYSDYKLSMHHTLLSKAESSNRGCVYLTKVAYRGVHSWTFQIVQMDTSRFTISIGVYKYPQYERDTSLPIRADKFAGRAYGWIVSGRRKFRGDSDELQTWAPCACKEGDVVSMILDLHKFELRFKVNDTSYGAAYQHIENTSYLAAVSCYRVGDAVKFISYTAD